MDALPTFRCPEALSCRIPAGRGRPVEPMVEAHTRAG